MRIYRGRLGLSLVLVAAACAFAPAVARADTGSITNVHDVGNGQLDATFSASGTDCTSYGFCGWFAYARQVPADQACSVSTSDLVWVGGYHDGSSSETATARFYRKYTPTKLCVIVDGATSEAVVAEAVWSPPPPPPPVSVSPGDGTMLTARSQVVFLARVEPHEALEVEVARSPALDADGTLANAEVVERGAARQSGYFINEFEYDSFGSWSRQPGTYYWQAHRTSCPVPGCNPNGEVRSLTIVLPTLRLSVAARSRQRLRAGFNNLAMRLKCNLRCRTEMTARPRYRRNGRRVALVGFRFHSTFRLPKGRAVSYGFNFTRRERADLAEVMNRYGSILWTLKYRGESASGASDRATEYIRMLPPLRPAAPPPQDETAPPPADCQGYSPCITPGPDVDCRGGSGNGPRYVDGPVRVYGSDPYGLDSDGDGRGCE